jgi:hypothetical protein
VTCRARVTLRARPCCQKRHMFDEFSVMQSKVIIPEDPQSPDQRSAPINAHWPNAAALKRALIGIERRSDEDLRESLKVSDGKLLLECDEHGAWLVHLPAASAVIDHEPLCLPAIEYALFHLHITFMPIKPLKCFRVDWCDCICPCRTQFTALDCTPGH